MFPTPSQGVNSPQLSHNTSRLQGEGREGKGRGGREKGRERRREGKGLPRVGFHPHVPNAEKYPGVRSARHWKHI